ncbi:MAG: hypothetical protein PHQ23_13815, partial [Candidatus Wallbacteria bacterium]|nr:hypothetical protein [Candidatus Wallbacteria bacterium]
MGRSKLKIFLLFLPVLFFLMLYRLFLQNVADPENLAEESAEFFKKGGSTACLLVHGFLSGPQDVR